MLATALNKYSESQKTKVDLDESFNLKMGQAPHDSDSGISTDGYQLLEELQSELREKTHLAHQLRSQLEFTDRQHEEVLATVTAERDSLRGHLNMLREENMTLSHVRLDYEEACERLCGSEQALGRTRRDLDAATRRLGRLQHHAAALENEKQILQELLTKSKEECHRINEMYASRQSSLLEENETLKTEHADLAARLQDQEEFMQQLIKEKVHLEMELTDVLNKSNQTQLKIDRSIDISYTEDQMLNALDSLNADSRFSQDTASVGTQAQVSCEDCEKRKAIAHHKSLRKYFWEPLKSLFQVFAVICFICAVCMLYGVVRRRDSCVSRGSSDGRGALPWRWLQPQDLMDLLLRIEYVADVPM
ncbi:girdin-like isoform X2 [Achroia grisella]|nr:girdin-like isoform X2 [Achroia grisella]